MDIKILIETLKRAEGFRSEPYPDANGWSVGYGHWSTQKPDAVSKEQADAILREDVDFFLGRLAGWPAWESCGGNDARERVLAEMAFNLGLDGLSKFKKMLAAIESRDFAVAADEILDSKAAWMLPKRYDRLAEMMRNGEDAA